MLKLRKYPLRIASGWAIISNNFLEIDISDKGDTKIQRNHLHSDLFFASKILFRDDIFQIMSNEPSIDLGWEFEGDAKNGYYLIRILKPDWDNVAFRLGSRNREIIADVIEIATYEIGNCESVPRAVELIKKHLEQFDANEWEIIENTV